MSGMGWGPDCPLFNAKGSFTPITKRLIWGLGVGLAMTDVEKLERLNTLREKGALTEQEYAQQKARILASSKGAASPRLWLGFVVAAIIALVAIALMQKPPERQGEAKSSATEAAVIPNSSPTESIQAPPSETPPAAKNVDPPVPTSAAPDPTNADYYNEAKRDMMRAYKDQPAGIRQMLGDYAGANTLCRGSSESASVEKWCPIRDALAGKLEKTGMCYGRPTDQSAAESDWHTCDHRDRQ